MARSFSKFTSLALTILLLGSSSVRSEDDRTTKNSLRGLQTVRISLPMTLRLAGNRCGIFPSMHLFSHHSLSQHSNLHASFTSYCYNPRSDPKEKPKNYWRIPIRRGSFSLLRNPEREITVRGRVVVSAICSDGGPLLGCGHQPGH